MLLLKHFTLLGIFLSFIVSCKNNVEKGIAPIARKVVPKMAITKNQTQEIAKLSEYSFFKGRIADLKPAKNVYEYKLNNSLFSDYSYKKRFIYFPKGKKMFYRPNGVMDFDIGSIIIKNFYYPSDFRNNEGEKQIIETRLLIKEQSQSWKTLSYVWNDEQTDAFINIIGGETPVSWIDQKGKSQKLNYIIPNQTQCKSCHMLGNQISPIGPIAGQLNRKNIYQGMIHNQLEYFFEKEVLNGLPQKDKRPRFAIWNQEDSGTISERAKAYLHINCAHCHNDLGPAKNSGLNLTYHEKNNRRRGIFKPPIAAGKGSGNLKFSIVPGKPENSIMIYRYNSTDPGIMMPEIGRKSVHQEGLALLEEYILSLEM